MNSTNTDSSLNPISTPSILIESGQGDQSSNYLSDVYVYFILIGFSLLLATFFLVSRFVARKSIKSGRVSIYAENNYDYPLAFITPVKDVVYEKGTQKNLVRPIDNSDTR